MPGEIFPGARPAEEPLIGEPEEGACRVDGPQIDGGRLGQPDRVDGAARGRRDLGRARVRRRAVSARRLRRRLAARQTRLAEETEHVARPVLEHLAARERPVLADRAARARVHDDRAVQGADADRRLAGNEPRRRAIPTVRVRQIDACDVGWERARRLTGIEALPADGVDDMKEHRRGGLDADQRRVAGAVEVADPHDQRVAAEDAHRPRIAKSPRGAGFPGHRGRRRAARVGSRIRSEHLQGDECGLGADQPGGRGGRRVARVAKGAQLAAVREHRVETHELLGGDVAPAQHQRQAVVPLGRQLRHPRALEQVVETGP